MDQNTQKAEFVRAGLRYVGMYPTEEGTRMMQDPEAQETGRQAIEERLSSLEPGDLLAVLALTSALVGI